MRLLALLACLSLAGCSDRVADTTIRFGLASAPTNLDPRFATDATSERINRLLYQSLVEFDDQSRAQPSLASWERVSPTHYRFHLREGIRFHNGEPLGAEDVAATYRSILDPQTASPHLGALSMIERIEVVDTSTVDFYLVRADLLFPGFLTIGILPADGLAADAPFQTHPLGSGPFRFVQWDTRQLLLERRRDAQRVAFEQVKDPTMRVLKLLRGEIDMLQNDLPPELLPVLHDEPGLQLQRSPGSNFAYIGFQLEDADTGDRRVRRAVASAIDREALIEHVFNSGAREAAALLPPEHWAGAPALEPVPFNPALARALLQAAGYTDAQPLTLSYKTSSDPFRVRIATVIQQQLAEVGVRVKVQSYDWGTFYGDIKAGRFQMYSLAWVGVKSPDIFRYAFHSASLPPDGANRGRLDNRSIDALIESATQGETLQAQAGVYRQLQANLLDLLVYIPLWYEDQYVVTDARVKGYTLAADGAYDALMNIQKVAP